MGRARRIVGASSVGRWQLQRTEVSGLDAAGAAQTEAAEHGSAHRGTNVDEEIMLKLKRKRQVVDK